MSAQRDNEVDEKSISEFQGGGLSRGSVVQKILGIASLGFALYAIWHIAPMLPVIGPLISKASTPLNLLEQAADPGKSKRTDFDKLVDAGGLDVYQSWHGLRVTNMNTRYADDGLLRELALTVSGTSKWAPTVDKWVLDSPTASPALIRSILSTVCVSDKWEVMETGGLTEKISNTDALQCAYNKLNERSSDTLVTIALNRPSNASPQTPSPSPGAPAVAPADQVEALTQKYLEMAKSAKTINATQGFSGLIEKSEECWNKLGNPAGKLDCVAADAAARQVLVAAGHPDPAGPFSLDSLLESAKTVSGPAASAPDLDQMISSLNQIMKNLLGQLQNSSQTPSENQSPKS